LARSVEVKGRKTRSCCTSQNAVTCIQLHSLFVSVSVSRSLVMVTSYVSLKYISGRKWFLKRPIKVGIS